MAPTGLRFLTSNHNQVDLDTYKRQVQGGASTFCMQDQEMKGFREKVKEQEQGRWQEQEQAKWQEVWTKENRGRSSRNWGTGKEM